MSISRIAAYLAPRYSAAMRNRFHLIGLLIILVLIEGARWRLLPSSAESQAIRGTLIVFLFAVPLALAALIACTQRRWAAMSVVMYGTIALALDLATMVQELSHEEPRIAVITLSLASSLGSFLLLVLGGLMLLTSDNDA
jgi:hypothetical protein